MTKSVLSISNYDYFLPEDRIAQKPLQQRDQSKLLVSRGDEIVHTNFERIIQHLPNGADLFFNNAKVIPARTYFKRSTGAKIEIFLLNPHDTESDIQQVLQSHESVIWDCMIRNLKKWKNDETISCEIIISDEVVLVNALIVDRSQMQVEFSWSGTYSFSEVLEALGKVPLPPYIKRDSEESDKDSYQTVYAKNEGAVAAPTAGLHFSDRIQNDLTRHNIGQHYLTLHVGAGTFKPVSSDKIDEHDMHQEGFEVDITTLVNIQKSSFRVAVGTTSLRTLESLYWIGVKLEYQHKNPMMVEQHVHKTSFPQLPTYEHSIGNIISYLEEKNLDTLKASTSIMIYPGYQIKSIDALITNFHLPKSTLIMLIASFIGDHWKTIYQEAINNDYRFLSYGDSSLLFPK